jgi:hypothetical protein
LFSTGYMANLGAVTALVGQGDTVLQDRLNHASLLDAGLLSGARSTAICTTIRPAWPAPGEGHRQYAGGHRWRVQHGRRLADLPALAGWPGPWRLADGR